MYGAISLAHYIRKVIPALVGRYIRDAIEGDIVRVWNLPGAIILRRGPKYRKLWRLFGAYQKRERAIELTKN